MKLRGSHAPLPSAATRRRFLTSFSISGRCHCRGDGEQRHDGEMLDAVLFVGDNERGFPGGKTYKISVGHFEDSPRSSFHFEWLVFRDQFFNQRCVHSIRSYCQLILLSMKPNKISSPSILPKLRDRVIG